MTGRGKFLLTIVILIGLFFAFQITLFIFHDTTARPVSALLNQYFKLKGKNQAGAKRALDLVLDQDPKNQTALRELGYWYLKNSDLQHATDQFEIAVKNDPNDAVAAKELLRLKTILAEKNNQIRPFDKNKITLQHPVEIPNPNYTVFVNSNPPTELIAESKQIEINPENMSRDQLLNKFYDAKRNNQNEEAWDAINTLIKKYPHDIQALKEAGYFALNQKNNPLAYFYFKQVYDINHDPYIALQIGYILDGMKERKLAYSYFEKATENPNLEDRYKAEIALTNLRDLKLKFLPDPFFFDLAFDPFYFSRFHLIVYPIIARAGVTLNQEYNLQAYLGYRRYSDNKSGSSGAISQIYEDNVAVTSLGIQGTPFPKIPLIAFMEGGRAKDLVYQNRGRWRGDFRTGLAYYNQWGHEPTYSFTPNFPFHFLGDIYADAIYFSRFRNTIATLRARPGFEVFRFNTTSIDIYFRGFLIQDTQREFFNNLYEIGPGIVLIPSDRYNFAIRYEFTQGHYLPASSPGDPNPYGAKYHNNVVQIDFFNRF